MRPLLVALLLLGCAPAGVDVTSAALSPGPELTALGPARATGMDEPPRTRVGFRFADGREVAIDREAIAFVPRWGAGAALVDPERRVYEVSPDGRRRMLARGAAGVLASDGERLAYVVSRDLLAELRVHDGAEERTLARGLSSIGVIRLGDPILVVAAAPGGVVGVWEIGDAGARCLSNCDLRTGEPWMDRFVPPPTTADALEVDDAHVAWTDPTGARHEVAR